MLKSARTAILLATLLTLAGCAKNDEGRIKDLVGDLVSALNKHDAAAAAALYTDGSLPPVTASGDSSVIFRMIHIPGGSDFEAANVRTTIAGDEARTSFDLTGKVRHSDSLAGTMMLRLRLELERSGSKEWKFLPGSEGIDGGQ